MFNRHTSNEELRADPAFKAVVEGLEMTVELNQLFGNVTLEESAALVYGRLVALEEGL